LLNNPQQCAGAIQHAAPNGPFPAQEVLVVLDPNFADRVRDAWRGQPVWITMSPVNAPEVRALWANTSSPNHLTGITGFAHDERAAAEDRLLGQLSMIDLHHGPYSTDTPYTVLTVIGAQLTEPAAHLSHSRTLPQRGCDTMRK
jgi:hypothetical protein